MSINYKVSGKFISFMSSLLKGNINIGLIKIKPKEKSIIGTHLNNYYLQCQLLVNLNSQFNSISQLTSPLSIFTFGTFIRIIFDIFITQLEDVPQTNG